MSALFGLSAPLKLLSFALSSGLLLCEQRIRILKSANTKMLLLLLLLPLLVHYVKKATDWKRLVCIHVHLIQNAASALSSRLISWCTKFTPLVRHIQLAYTQST